MKVTLLKADEIDAGLKSRWNEIQNSSPELESPFYSPVFTSLVARHCDNIEVAVIDDCGEIVGFFPFQRGKRNHGKPVGWKINDYQGCIRHQDRCIPARELLQGCRLNSWRFDHLPASSSRMDMGISGEGRSPVININEGFDAYMEEKRIANSKRIKSHLRKARKIEREIGPLRLEFHAPKEEVFGKIMKWKALQLAEMGVNNAFEQKWAFETARDIVHTDEPGFQGTLSALYVEDQLIASHLGMRNDRVLHWWVPTYNREFERYSPGAILLLKAMETCMENKVTKIDLGKGNEGYKQTFQNGFTELREGVMTGSAWQQFQFRSYNRFRDSVRGTRLARSAKSGMIRLRRLVTTKPSLD